MNSKLEKYTEERDKIAEKIAALDARRKALENKIMEVENLEIRALMRSEKLSLSELMDLVRSMQENQRSAAVPVTDNDDEADDEVQETRPPFYYEDEDANDAKYEEDTDDEEV